MGTVWQSSLGWRQREADSGASLPSEHLATEPRPRGEEEDEEGAMKRRSFSQMGVCVFWTVS